MITNKPWFSSYPAGVAHYLSFDRYGSLLDLLDESFKTHRERPAYWCMGKHFSYEAIDLASKQLASYLQSLGL